MIWGFLCGVLATLLGLFVVLFQVNLNNDRTKAKVQAAKSVRLRLANSHSKQPAPGGGKKIRFPKFVQQHLQDKENHRLVEAALWVDVLLQHCYYHFAQALHNVEGELKLEAYMNNMLADLKLPDTLGPINITDVKIGDSSPYISDVKIAAWSDESKTVDIEFGVVYAGNMHVCMESDIRINYPIPLMAQLPFEASLSNLRLDLIFRLTIDFFSPEMTVTIYTVAPANVAFDIHTEIGYQSTIKDVPHFKSILEPIVASAIDDLLLFPNKHEISLNLIPQLLSLLTSYLKPTCPVVHQSPQLPAEVHQTTCKVRLPPSLTTVASASSADIDTLPSSFANSPSLVGRWDAGNTAADVAPHVLGEGAPLSPPPRIIIPDHSGGTVFSVSAPTTPTSLRRRHRAVKKKQKKLRERKRRGSLPVLVALPSVTEELSIMDSDSD